MFGKRWFWQTVSTTLANAYWRSIFVGSLYRGWSKGICFPGLNCYSCPMATMACPLGSLQQALASLRILPKQAITGVAYILGTILLFSLIFGRFVCGWICPFGFLQEIIYKIPYFPKKSTPKSFRPIKYILLFFLIFVFPLSFIDATGYGKAWFCRFLCPAGTFEAGIFNLALHPGLRTLIGIIFYFKLFILAMILILCMIYLRFFCVVFCPLGAFYGLWQRFGLIKLKWEVKRCLDCKICEEICPIGLKIPQELDSKECIRCLKCLRICPAHAIYLKGL